MSNSKTADWIRARDGPRSSPRGHPRNSKRPAPPPWPWPSLAQPGAAPGVCTGHGKRKKAGSAWQQPQSATPQRPIGWCTLGSRSPHSADGSKRYSKYRHAKRNGGATQLVTITATLRPLPAHPSPSNFVLHLCHAHRTSLPPPTTPLTALANGKGGKLLCSA